MTEGTSRKEPVSEVTVPPVAPVDFCNRLQIRIILFHQFWQRTSPLFSFYDYLLHPPRRFVNMNRLNDFHTCLPSLKLDLPPPTPSYRKH